MPTTHARFRAWLELGPSRNLATYAAVLGVSKQSLSETAARFNWRQRAAAWDAAEAAAGRCPPPPPVATPAGASRLRRAAHPGYAGVGVPGDLHL